MLAMCSQAQPGHTALVGSGFRGLRKRAAPDWALERAELQDLLPGIINQLGPDNLANLKKLAETYQGGNPPPGANADDDDDEDVPDLVDNFEEASK